MAQEAQAEEVCLPPEWAYLRHQVIAGATTKSENVGFWEIQRLAWEGLSQTVVYLPGATQASELVRTVGRELPGSLVGLAGAAWRWLGRPRNKRRGR